MDRQPYSPRQMGLYFALAQVGLEMVAPLGLGVWLDLSLGWLPWATLTGCVLGFVGGLVHLMVLVKNADAINRDRPGGDEP